MSYGKEVQIRAYLQEKVDPYLKPLLMDLMKSRPDDVHQFIVDWLPAKGNSIHEGLNAQVVQSPDIPVHHSHHEIHAHQAAPENPPEEAPQEPVEPSPQEEAPAS